MKIVKLGQITKNLDSRRKPLNNIQRLEKSSKKVYPYYGANNIIDYIDDYIFDETEELLCIAEDGGSWGFQEKCTYIVKGRCWINNHAHVLKATTDVDIYYLSYFLNYTSLSSYITGTTRGKLTKTSLENIEVKLPPVVQQIRILNRLKKIDNLISLRKDELNALDNLIKSRFNEMFGDPVENNQKWLKNKLSRLGYLGRGVSKHRPRNAPELLGGNYPLIQTGEVANSELFIDSYTDTYSELGLSQSKIWSKGTLCITIAANIAKTGILTFDACFPDSIVGFIAGESTNNIFIHYWFTYFQKILESQAPESAQKNINLKILNDLDVILPPLTLQEEFARFVEAVDKSKFVCQKWQELVEKLLKIQYNKVN